MIENAFRPRRSCLYMPGINTRALEKARSLPSDMLILDLEDAVAADAKADARARVVEAIAAGGYGKREVVVRVNGLATAWGLDDIKAALAASPDGLLVPKIDCAEDILRLDALVSELVSELGTASTIGLWAMIETPNAILNIQEIAETAKQTHLLGFVVGTNDLAKDIDAMYTPSREAFQVALSLTLMAAKANGLVAIDGVFNDIQDQQGFHAECMQGRVLGFDGKTLIHPSQLAVANEVFSPSEDALAHAKAVIEAFALPENSEKGVLKVNGKMTEVLHLEQSKKLVEIAEAIVALSNES